MLLRLHEAVMDNPPSHQPLPCGGTVATADDGAYKFRQTARKPQQGCRVPASHAAQAIVAHMRAQAHRQMPHRMPHHFDKANS